MRYVWAFSRRVNMHRMRDWTRKRIQRSVFCSVSLLLILFVTYSFIRMRNSLIAPACSRCLCLSASLSLSLSLFSFSICLISSFFLYLASYWQCSPTMSTTTTTMTAMMMITDQSFRREKKKQREICSRSKQYHWSLSYRMSNIVTSRTTTYSIQK
jgi:hypothetical protein